MRREAGLVEKPERVHHHSLKGRARDLAEKAAAGDITANHVAIGALPRGTGEQCRYHATYSLDFIGHGGNMQCAGRSGDKRSYEGSENAHAMTKETEPLSVDKKRHEARRMLQEMMSKSVDQLIDPATKPSAGWERPHPRVSLTESHSARHYMRYDNPVRQREAPAPKAESYRARQDCRFHGPPSPRTSRSFTPDGGRVQGGLRHQKASDERSYAGRASDTHLRHDTPGGQDRSLGRVRSVTPDYHRRYGSNLIGSSLPGSRAAAAADVEQSQAIGRAGLGVTRHGASACDPRSAPLTSSVQARHAHRFHCGTPEDAHIYGKRHSQDFTSTAAPATRSPQSTPRGAERSGDSTRPTAVVSVISSSGGAPAGGGSPAVTSWQSLEQRALGSARGVASTPRGRPH